MKRTLFFASLFVLPFLILILLEGGLRLFGYGQSYDLWQKHGVYYAINPKFPQLFFSQNDIAIPEFIPQNIPVKKSANTVRIVCLGGSTTEGFPFEVDINFPHFLQCYLQQTDPSKRWQVINLGLSAINSHSVRFMLPEILKIKPDIILIYMGHNEFYGALGLASNSFLGPSPTLVQWLLRLKKIRLYQFLESVFHAFSPKKKNASTTLMAAMIKKSAILPNGRVYRTTLKNFKINLGKIASRFEQKGIPVLVSTLVSNLKDQKPLGYPNPQKAIPHYLKIARFIKQQQWQRAVPLLKHALQKDNTNPLSHYFLGRCYYNLKNFEAAKPQFILAKDFDRLPFRAPSEMNAIIRNLCRRSSALLVSTDSLFSALSPHGIMDSTLFLEHLHPNENGYQLLAQSFFQTMQQYRVLSLGKMHLPFQSCTKYTNLDIAIGELKIADLVSHPPFNGRTHFKVRHFSPPLIHRLAYEHVFGGLYWDAAHLKLGDRMAKNGNEQEALKEYFAVLESDSQHVSALYKIGDVYLNLRQLDQAVDYYSRAEKSDPQAAFVKAKLARALLLNGNFAQSLDVINRILENSKLRAQFNARQMDGLRFLKALALKEKQTGKKN